MRIDAHQHFWKFDPVRDAWIDDTMLVIRRDFLPDDLFPLLQAQDLDGCVAVQADQSEQETRFLLDLAEENPWIKGVVGWVDLRSAALESRLEYFSQFPVLKGFRHIIQAEPADRFILDPAFGKGIRLLGKYGFTYDILVFPRHLPHVVEFVRQFPEQPFVLDHLAKPFIKKGEISPWKEQIQVLAACPNVYCKLSGMITEADWQRWQPADLKPYIDVVLEAFGPGRVMFGSDWPVCLLAGTYSRMYEVLEDLTRGLSDTEKAQLWGGNAATFYKL